MAFSTSNETGVLNKTELIREGLEQKLSPRAKSSIQDLLLKIDALSDVEKLLLYLQLPTGVTSGSKDQGSVLKPEQSTAITWIKSHLELNEDFCVTKRDIYDDYRLYCEKHGHKALSQSDLSRLLRQCFPDIKSRRLGQRGISRQCYGGLRKQIPMKPLTMPAVGLPCPPRDVSSLEYHSEEDRLSSASWSLILEWAQKLLGKGFADVQNLAEYLVSNQYVNGRSTAAFTVLAASQRLPATVTPGQIQAVSSPSAVGSSFTCGSNGSGSGGSSNSQRQQQAQTGPRQVTQRLAEKLQEKSVLKEQKRRLEQQRCINTGEKMTSANSEAAPTKVEPDSELWKALDRARGDSKDKKKGVVPKSVTAQKLILPKTVAATTSQGGGISLPSQGNNIPATVGGSSTATSQSIVLLSPTAGAQSLLILSPVQAQAVKKAQHSMPAQPIAPVLKSTRSGAHARPQTKEENQQEEDEASPPVISELPELRQPKVEAGRPVGMDFQQAVGMEVEGKDQEVLVEAKPTFSESSSTTGDTDISLATRVDSPIALGVRQGLEAHCGTDSKTESPVAGGVAKLQLVAQTQNQTEQNPLELISVCPGGTGQTPLVLTALALQQQQPQPVQRLQRQNQVTQCSRSGANTPVKNKLSGRRVSDLLKERRGYGPQDEIVPFVHDRRPVSQLLKESRQRQAQMLAAGSSPAASTSKSPSWPQDTKKQMNHGFSKRQSNNELLLQALSTRSKSVTGDLLQSATSQGQPRTNGSVRVVSSNSSSPTDQLLTCSLAAALQQQQLQSALQQQQPNLLQNGTPALLQRARSEPAFEADLQHSQGSSPAAQSALQSPLATLLMPVKEGRQQDMLQEQQQQTAVEGRQHLANIDSPEVNVSNLERDALHDSCEHESTSDLADFTPANFGMVGSQNVETATEQQNADLDDALVAQQAVFGEADLKGESNTTRQLEPDFFSPPKVQRNAGRNVAGMDLSFVSGFQAAVNETSDFTPHFRSHPTLGGTASFGGSRSVGQSPIDVYQGSKGSSPTPMPSPASSHRSTTSTPMSMLSPQSNQFQLAGSAADNAFTPIQQTSIASVSRVCPVKPMATVASGPPLVGLDTTVDTQTLTTPLQSSDLVEGGTNSLVMSSEASHTWAVPSNPRPSTSFDPTTLEEKLSFPQPPAASSLAQLLGGGKPSKRSKPQSSVQGPSKRMRHRSAQSSFNSLRNSGGNTSGFTMGHHPQQQLLQTRHSTLGTSTHLQQQQPQPQPQSLTVGTMLPQTFNQEPESPFSPEISEIMDGARVQCALNDLNRQLQRSHSVPIQNMFSACQDFLDQENVLTILGSERNQTGGTMQELLQNMSTADDLGSLLQDKLQDDSINPERGIQMGCNVNYNARKNLTELLETRSDRVAATSTDTYGGGYSRGDHMISGASVHMTTLRMPLNSDVHAEAGFVAKMPEGGASYPSHSVPTPPSSHNASPDFSSEMAGMMEQGAPYGLNRAAVAGMATSAMGTPNSLDTVAPPEGKEQLTESLFPGMYETTTESTPALGNNQQMSYWD